MTEKRIEYLVQEKSFGVWKDYSVQLKSKRKASALVNRWGVANDANYRLIKRTIIDKVVK